MDTITYVKFKLTKTKKIWMKVGYTDGDYTFEHVASEPVTNNFEVGDTFVIHKKSMC